MPQKNNHSSISSSSTWIAFLLVLLLSIFNVNASSTVNQLRGNSLESRQLISDSNSSNDYNNDLLCRITILDITSDDGEDREPKSSQEIRCIPIVDEQETDDDFSIHLPDDILEAHQSDIYQGRLFVTVSDAVYVNHQVFIGAEPQFTVVQDSHHRYRHLVERHLQTTHEVTVAIIRISTPAESPVPSLSTLTGVYFGDHGFQKQFNDCSFGRLQLKNAGAYDIRISQSLSSLGNDFQRVVDAAQSQIRSSLGKDANSLANKVIMCLPAGTYTNSFSASALLGSWRVQIRSDYCLSLSTTMHELGTFPNVTFRNTLR
jgi:hypothetical protein